MFNAGPKIKSTFAPPIFIQAPLINYYKEKEKISFFPNRKMISKIKKTDLKKINAEEISSNSENRRRARVIKLNWGNDGEEVRAENALPYYKVQSHIQPPIRGRRGAIRY